MNAHTGILVLVLFAAASVGCSSETESPDIVRFASSELHALGSSCSGDYLAVDKGDFILVEKSGTSVLQKDIKLSDLGSHRLAIATRHGSIDLVTTFTLKHDNTVAVFEDVNFVPQLTPEQLDELKLPRDFKAKMTRIFKDAFPTLVLCPLSGAT
ncbi:hypothetical protein [Rhizobium sp. R693]|uniref:hypothetical protein n=1 Tax=Rhizobium sp. R693 TaxID=1764276 RepID=UPI0011302515|nr:hypothetical protein [Rhizobium sp. R693]